MIPGHSINAEPVLGDQAPRGAADGYRKFIANRNVAGVYLVDVTSRRKGEGQLLAAPTDILGDPVLGDQPRGGFSLGQPRRHFFASHSWIGRPDDRRRANVVARPRLRTALNISRSFPFLPGEARSVQATSGFVEFGNDDAVLDWLATSATSDGLPVAIRHGPRRGYFDDFSLRLAALGRSYSGTSERVRLELLNDASPVAKPVAGSYYSGEGGLRGDFDLAGQPVPTALGTTQNISLTLIWRALEIWQAAEGPLQAFNAVYDGGVPLIILADVPTLADLIAYAVTPGACVTCKALGLVRFYEPPSFKYTADVQGLVVEGQWLSTLSELTEFMTRYRAGLLANEIDRAAIFGIGAVSAGYFSGSADAQVTDFLEAAARSILGFHGRGVDGRYRLKRVFAPSSYAMPTPMPVSGNGIRPEDFESTVRSSIEVRYARNWTPMQDSEIAGAISGERRLWLKSQGSSVVIPNGSAAAFYKTSKPGDPIDTLIADQGWAETIGKEALKLVGEELSFYSVDVGRRGFALDGGDPVAFETDRYGAGGVVWLVRGIEEKSDGETLTLKVVGFPKRL
jgi:hypothetical protein